MEGPVVDQAARLVDDDEGKDSPGGGDIHFSSVDAPLYLRYGERGRSRHAHDGNLISLRGFMNGNGLNEDAKTQINELRP